MQQGAEVIMFFTSPSVLGFFGSYASFKLRNLAKIKYTGPLKQFVSSDPLKLFNRVSWNIVIDKDIIY